MKHTILALLTVAVAWDSAVAQTTSSRPGYLPRDVRERLLTGVAVTFEDANGDTDTRLDRLPALFVERGATATPFLAPGPFHATFRSWLRTRLRGDFEFRVHATGRVRIEANGEELLSFEAAGEGDSEVAAVSLSKGYNDLVVDYASPADANAVLRVYWRSDEFPWGPLPVDRLWADGADDALAAGLDVRRGRELYANRLCGRCHASGIESNGDEFAGMPELAHDAPSLATAGRRLTPEWVAQWLVDPGALRNEVSMPSLLHGMGPAESRATAADVAAYVTTLGTTEKPRLVEATEDVVERGEFLYETRGCMACHRLTPPGEDDEADRVSLHFTAAKYRPGALAEFLRNTRAHYRWSRMPSFDFDVADAAALEAFVRTKSRGTLGDTMPGDAGRGRTVTAKLGCAQCHAVERNGPRAPNRAGIDVAEPNGGCLAETPSPEAPNFRFGSDDRRGLVAFLSHASRAASLSRSVPTEFAGRAVRELNCTACHARDDMDADLPLLAAEEGELGLLPDPIPGLTWVGEKLEPSWSRELFAGTLGYRLRDHFRARMPAFPARGDVLAIGLSTEHGFDPHGAPSITFTDDLAELGRAVGAPQTGLSCIRCHPIGDAPPTAPEQARSTNLAYTRRRMRHEFYTRWMLFPQRVEYNTRMIRFAPDGVRTGLDGIEDGDARKQFEAVWNWLGALHEERKRVENGRRRPDSPRKTGS